MMILNKIGQIIKNKDNFAVISHVSPDGDSIGSMLALYNALKEYGKTVDLFIDDEITEKYSFLPGYKNIKNISNLNNRYSSLFILDCGDILRTGNLKDLFEFCDIKINIDHHISNTLFGDINYVDTNASSVGEIIYQLLKINGFDISYNTALCLYTSILTDTGGFKYSNTTSMTFNIVGDLINTGINFSEIYSRVYDIKTLTQTKLMAKIISTLETYFNDKVAVLTMSKKILDELNAKECDADEFVNIARNIDTVEIGIFIKQIDEKNCRVSLRSKNNFDVSKIAVYFNGGGHIRASGCTIEGNIEQVKVKLLDAIQNILEVK